jgi:hypothetical protein
VEPVELAGEFAEAQQITMPCDWATLFGDRAGTARFTRWFNWVAHPDGETRVAVVFHGVGGRGEVRVNDAKVGTIGVGFDPIALDIVRHLRRRNELVVELTFDPRTSVPPGGLYDVVALQIESDT